MKFSLAMIAANARVIVKEFDTHSRQISDRLIDMDDLQNEPIGVLFYSNQGLDESTRKIIDAERRSTPCRDQDKCGLSREEFNALSPEGGYAIFSETHEKWIMANALHSIEHMSTISSHLRNLWTRDRNAFIDEFWFFLRTVLGCAQLRLIYHDLIEVNAELEKHKLGTAYAIGTKLPEQRQGEAPEKQLLEHYSPYFRDPFTVTEYSPEKGELVIAMSIQGSPLLAMANTMMFNQLQRSVLAGIMNGLQ